MSLGQRTLNGKPVITSTASAPPTPMATMPRPPALGVWLSVPIIIPPGKAYCSSTTWWMMPAARLPEADAVLGRDRLEEVVDLGVGRRPRRSRSTCGAVLGLDEVVAVHGGRHRHLGQARGHELQQRHLRGGVLHGHAVGVEVGVGTAPRRGPAPRGSRRWLIEDLLGEGERPAEALAAEGDPLGEPRVDARRRARSGCWRRRP